METIKKFTFCSRKDKQIIVEVFSTCQINAEWQLNQHVKNVDDFRIKY